MLSSRDHRSVHTLAEDPGRVCRWCLDRWSVWLAEIVEWWALVPASVELGSVPSALSLRRSPGKVSGSPALLRLSAWSLLHPEVTSPFVTTSDGAARSADREGVPDVPLLLTNWTTALHGVALGRPAFRHVAPAAAFLRAHLEQLAALPDCDEFDTDLRWIRCALQVAVGATDPVPLGYCLSVTSEQSCRGLVWRDGPARGCCDRCGRVYGKLDLARLAVHEDQRSRRRVAR